MDYKKLPEVLNEIQKILQKSSGILEIFPTLNVDDLPDFL